MLPKKLDATWARRTAEAEKKGDKVLSAKETKEIFPYASDRPSTYGKPYVDPEEEQYHGGKYKKIRQLVGKEDLPKPVLARAPSGRIIELWHKVEVDKILAKRFPKEKPLNDHEKFRKSERDHVKKRKLQNEARRRTLAKVIEAVEQGMSLKSYVELLSAIVLETAPDYDRDIERICKRREKKSKKMLLADAASCSNLMGVVLEYLLEDRVRTGSPKLRSRPPQSS
jgi:hypothetical protein